LRPVIAALAVGTPVAMASAASSPATKPAITGPSCPDGYAGPTNLATGCPYWLMSYTVKDPGQAPFRCPAYWGPDLSLNGAGAGSVGQPLAGCSGVTTAN
jgi:hypothetical protein